jgi:hypothetical protein
MGSQSIQKNPQENLYFAPTKPVDKLQNVGIFDKIIK